MTTNVDYSQDICEGCGAVLDFGDDPTERPRHLCGDEARTVAFALWIRHRVAIADRSEDWRYRYRREGDEIESAEQFEERAKKETLSHLDEAGVPEDEREPAKKLADRYPIADARTLYSAFRSPKAMASWPKSADLMKKYFPSEPPPR